MIVLKNLSKTYRSHLGIFSRKQPSNKPSLANINLSIASGEKVAILGRNGSGKTTLLRLVSGSLKPTEGSIELNGTVHTLMSTGLGVSERFTGYENIISSFVYEGVDLKDYEKLSQEIIDFCELKDYLYKPICYYSLGMRMRLMFAIATVIKPEILVIDEVLGAGDPYFLLKCQNRLQNLIQNNHTTALIVSHSTQQLRQFCDRAIWLKDGEIFYDAEVNEVVNAYEAYIEQYAEKGKSLSVKKPTDLLAQLEDGKLVYRWNQESFLEATGIDLENQAGVGELCKLQIKLKSSVSLNLKLRILVTFWGKNGKRVARLETETNDFSFIKEKEEVITATFSNALPEGTYTISISLYDCTHHENTVEGAFNRIDVISHAVSFASMTNDPRLRSNIHPHQWK